jgi:hypothetical protein
VSRRGLLLGEVAVFAAVASLGVACHDVSSFSTASGGSYEGPIASASFVRTGLGKSRMCLTIDTNHLQDAPGAVSTDDGLFQKTPLRSIPQLWQDPLSTLSFGEGRIQNVVYMARGNAIGGHEAGDIFVVVSFMVAGDIEVRVLRGAPATTDGGSSPGLPSLFGVFTLSRASGACAY